jgi:hypothetical protein
MLASVPMPITNEMMEMSAIRLKCSAEGILPLPCPRPMIRVRPPGSNHTIAARRQWGRRKALRRRTLDQAVPALDWVGNVTQADPGWQRRRARKLAATERGGHGARRPRSPGGQEPRRPVANSARLCHKPASRRPAKGCRGGDFVLAKHALQLVRLRRRSACRSARRAKCPR